MLGEIRAAHANEDILAAASRQRKKNLFAGVSLESLVLTLKDPQLSFADSTVSVRGTCFLLSHAEAVKTLKQRVFAPVYQGRSSFSYAYAGARTRHISNRGCTQYRNNL